MPSEYKPGDKLNCHLCGAALQVDVQPNCTMCHYYDLTECDQEFLCSPDERIDGLPIVFVALVPDLPAIKTTLIIPDPSMN